MFPLLIESFFSRRSNEISMEIALGHCFLPEIPDSKFFWGIMVKSVCSRKNENMFNTRIIGKI